MKFWYFLLMQKSPPPVNIHSKPLSQWRIKISSSWGCGGRSQTDKNRIFFSPRFMLQRWSNWNSKGDLVFCRWRGRVMCYSTFWNTVKPVLSGHSKIDKTKVLKTNGSLMKVEIIAECSLGAFCNTFDLHWAMIGLETQFLVFILNGR